MATLLQCRVFLDGKTTKISGCFAHQCIISYKLFILFRRMDESVGRMRDDMEALLSEDSSDEDDDNQRQGDFWQEIFS